MKKWLNPLPWGRVRERVAFSLVELMISLIVISIVTAAFTPILTKKLKTSDMSIGSGAVDYIFDETICSVSKSNCSVCIKDECVKCIDGYYLDNSDGNCKECTSNCLACTSSAKCNKCREGYYISGSTCASCLDKIQGCAECSSDGTKCKICKSGYYLSSGTCKSCSTNLRGCTECSSDGTRCLTCVANCELCNLEKGCIKCKLGSFYDGKDCSPCTYDTSILVSGSYKMYRYNVGDECGPPIPEGINVCTVGLKCPYGTRTPICYKATNIPSGFTGALEYGYPTYLPYGRTRCNGFAAAVIAGKYNPLVIGAGTPTSDLLMLAKLNLGALNEQCRKGGIEFTESYFEQYMPDCSDSEKCVKRVRFQQAQMPYSYGASYSRVDYVEFGECRWADVMSQTYSSFGPCKSFCGGIGYNPSYADATWDMRFMLK